MKIWINLLLFQLLDTAKTDLSQNQDKWDLEKAKILQQHSTKFQVRPFDY